MPLPSVVEYKSSIIEGELTVILTGIRPQTLLFGMFKVEVKPGVTVMVSLVVAPHRST